ncbi:MAG: EVE domain-containing protein [Myxococcota bacterium]
MANWLMKTEPETFSWQDLVRDGQATWDGVRNYTARNHLSAMQVGDRALIYHSVSQKQAVGIARVSRTAFPDPTTDDPRWVAVEVQPLVALARPVTLDAIKHEAGPGGPLEGIRLLRENRLSVVPLQPHEWQRLLVLADTPDPE